MNEVLTYEIEFLIYLFIQALFVNGLYISAAGRTDILPDGTEVDSEMILYPIYKLLNRYAIKRIPFTYEEIKNRVGSNFPMLPKYRITWIDNPNGEGFKVTNLSDDGIDFKSLKTWAEAYLQAKISYDQTTELVTIYQEIERYKFSKYLRKPVITCVICMASFWSIFIFLIPIVSLYGLSVKIVLIWIGNVFCLSYLNYLIFKARK